MGNNVDWLSEMVYKGRAHEYAASKKGNTARKQQAGNGEKASTINTGLDAGHMYSALLRWHTPPTLHQEGRCESESGGRHWNRSNE